MKQRQHLILAGTALALLMGSQAATMAAPGFNHSLATPDTRLLIPVQNEEPPQQETPAESPAAEPEAPPPPAEAPAPEAPAVEVPAAEPPAERVEEPAREAEPSAPPPAPAPSNDAPAVPQAPATDAQQAPAEPSAPAPQAPAPAEAPPPAEAPAPAEPPAPPPPANEQPAPQAPSAPAPVAPTQPPADAAPQSPPADAPAIPQAPSEPQPSAPAPTAPQPPADAPAAPTPPAGDAAAPPPPENAAPILDSQKEQAPAPAGGEAAPAPSTPAPADQSGRPPRGDNAGRPARQEAAPQAQPAAPPQSDSDAQVSPITRDQIRSSIEEKGERLELNADQARERFRDRRRERGNAEVVREFDDNRAIIQLNNNVFIDSSDEPRIARGARDVYYEELPRGRTREVVERENGVRVVTIRNSYGDVIRRSRITPDDREYVLYYLPEDQWDREAEWRDPGEDLPPLRLTIPANEYILDAESVEDPDRYYEFLDQPPVERVQRLYSVDEVKRSARIRDTVRRIDLDVINFEFGSANIAEGEVRKLQSVADAMARMLEGNPAETFLIEGHTDAVGSDLANLALSDRRAESVAQALTSVFEIPPENLATQGYGEQYLKVRTEEPDRENRRVAIRRITPLVAPVASAN